MLNVDTNKCKKENGQENEKQGIPAADAKTKEQPGSQQDTTVLDCKAAQHSQIPYSATGSFNRQYQDRLFKAIFEREEHKDWLLSLYNALNGSSYTDPSAIEINTIEGIIYVTMKNDISFLIDSQLNLYEQQSSYNPNMPLRGLMYFSQLYQKYISKQRKDIYSSALLKIPRLSL